jgi:hypothetical protein
MLHMGQFAGPRAKRSTRADLQARGMVPWSELGGVESTYGAALNGDDQHSEPEAYRRPYVNTLCEKERCP